MSSTEYQKKNAVSMPIPKPKSDEKQSDFVFRCAAEIGDEYLRDQAIAICYQQWRDNK
jgi:hypothetical protein